jgi:Ni,Fe-hydrogenase III small subunit
VKRHLHQTFSDGQVVIQDTYAVGDGTDKWCGSDTLVPEDMYIDGVYPQPTCGLDNCFYVRGQFKPLTSGKCKPNDAGPNIFFCSD